MIKKVIVFSFVNFTICLSLLQAHPVFESILEETVEDTLLEKSSSPYQVSKIKEPSWEHWKHIEPLPVVMHTPNFGNEPTHDVEIRIAYDDQYLYVYGRFKMDPSEIQVASYRRDYTEADSDYFGLVLDTFNDNRNALVFYTAPTGLRSDFTVSNDASGPSQNIFNLSWDTYWYAEAEITDRGWSALFQIPFSSLHFETQSGKVEMGFTVFQNSVKKNEIAVFPAIEPRWGRFSHVKPSQTQTVIFKGIEPANPIYIRPYILGGSASESILNQDETAFISDRNITGDIGLDVKYGLTSNLTIDATLNTDFAQVEADAQQVNLTRHSLFFPEKRLFFQEQSSRFMFNFGGSNRLFHSRRIGLHEGEEVRILGGLRLAGREGPWDIGLLNVQTAPHDRLASENLGILRLTHQVFNLESYIGSISTTRIGMDGSYNIVQGVDGFFKLFSDDYFEIQLAQVFDSGVNQNSLFDKDLAKYRLRWQRRAYEGLAYDLSLSRTGAQFMPGLGFQLRHDVLQQDAEVSYGWVPGEESSLTRHRFTVGSTVYLRNMDRSVQTALFDFGWDSRFKTNITIDVNISYFHEDVLEEFLLPEQSSVPAGNYDYFELSGGVGTPSGRNFSSTFKGSYGGFFDGQRWSMEINSTWVASPHLRFDINYDYNNVRFNERNQSFDTHISRLRMEGNLNKRWMSSTFVQYNSAENLVVGNVRIRYQSREGNDLYLVYNETLNTDRDGSLPVMPWTQNRTVMLKYNHTFQW